MTLINIPRRVIFLIFCVVRFIVSEDKKITRGKTSLSKAILGARFYNYRISIMFLFGCATETCNKLNSDVPKTEKIHRL